MLKLLLIGNHCSHGGSPAYKCFFHGFPGLGSPSRRWADEAGSSRQPLLWAVLQLPALCPQNNVVGRLCNECVAGSFHLSARNPDGCLKCFCMGVSRQCTSSSWSRAQVPMWAGGETAGSWGGQTLSPGWATRQGQPPSPMPASSPPPRCVGLLKSPGSSA